MLTALSGGVGSLLGHGSFGSGAARGAIVTGLNHLVHSIEEGLDKGAQKRKLIRQNALKYKGSKKWAFSVSKDNFASGTNKCNQFVYDVLRESGVDVPLPNGNPIKRFFGLGSPPTAGQWADPSYDIPGFTVVEVPQAGDIVAVSGNFSNATGHVGIMISSTQSIGTSYYSVRISDFGSANYNLSNYPGNKGYTYRRYIGQ